MFALLELCCGQLSGEPQSLCLAFEEERQVQSPSLCVPVNQMPGIEEGQQEL